MHNIENLLTPRLKMVASLVPESDSVCDIGTDHAYVALYLVKKGISKRVIAADIKKGPLMQATKNICAYGESLRVETRLSNGFENISKGEANTAVIAGMGGETICEILKNDIGIENFVLQPQSGHCELRAFLLENGYVIKNEKISREGRKMYVAMLVSRGKMESLTLPELEIGPILIKERPPLFNDYVKYRLYEINSIYDKIISSNASERLEEITTIKNLYEDLIK
ncbi:MAG: SAM-dependent methyltransferase [Clostridia bacterium]|nr:SAM-dependent methyltransferase [Clostridia bacterium]